MENSRKALPFETKEKIVKDQIESGLSIEKYCEGLGIHFSTFYAYKKAVLGVPDKPRRIKQTIFDFNIVQKPNELNDRSRGKWDDLIDCLLSLKPTKKITNPCIKMTLEQLECTPPTSLTNRKTSIRQAATRLYPGIKIGILAGEKDDVYLFIVTRPKKEIANETAQR